MIGLLGFFVPEEYLPSFADIACMLVPDHAHEACMFLNRRPSPSLFLIRFNMAHFLDASKKRPAFSSWNKYEPELRAEVLAIVGKGFCRFGYDRLFRTSVGDTDLFSKFCRDIEWSGLGGTLEAGRNITRDIKEAADFAILDDIYEE